MMEEYPVGVSTLEEFCANNPRVALAFSGGCDSSYLLSVLLDKGVEVRPYYVNTAFQADFELTDAQDLAHDLGSKLQVLERDVFSQPEILANPENRCYLCKRFIFGSIIEDMKKYGFEVLADGTNASDDPSRRPGFRALAELGVVSPLRLAGFTKDDIRKASQERGLFTHEKPNFSCLATKVETDTPITKAKLEEIAKRSENGAWR